MAEASGASEGTITSPPATTPAGAATTPPTSDPGGVTSPPPVPTPPSISSPPPAALSPEMTLAVHQEVQRLVDRELGRIVKIALPVLLFLGIATFADVWVKTPSIVKAEVDALIQRADSSTSVDRTLNDLVNRAVVASYLISLRKAEPAAQNPLATDAGRRTAGPERERSLAFADWARLDKWIQDKSLDDQDFLDALEVLASQDETRVAGDAKDFLAEMLNPPATSRFSWMLTQSNKRLAILQTFRQRGLGAAALEIAVASDNSKELRQAALDYIQASQFRSAFDRLFTLTTGGDADLRLPVLLTCAWLDPLRGEIIKTVDDTLKGRASEKDVGTSIKLAEAIWYAPSATSERAPRQIKDAERKERFKHVTDLLNFAFAHGTYVIILSGNSIALVVQSSYRPFGAFVAPREKFGRLQPYWEMLESAAGRGDLQTIERLAPRSCARDGLNALTATLKGASRITIANSTLDGTQVPEFILARLPDAERRRAATLTVRATDRFGRQLQGPLTGLAGDGFEFRLPADFGSVSCPP